MSAISSVWDNGHRIGAQLLNIVTGPLFRFGQKIGYTTTLHVKWVELYTIGRKTGLRRKSIMPSVLHTKDRFVLVPTYGGHTKSPGWVHNITAKPEIEVAMDGKIIPMRGHIADESEREEIWGKLVVRSLGIYAVLQAITTRKVQLIILERI
ncbi:nitroreductase/quinone reductase family protein [Gordonia sp. CPCC 205333]|uniref:nitroreductase/quinone reductase family protein n=1 Tax=Gordonia sp. CPCC 205333 TaxID=3140790 RepID=UPI003AF38F15